MKLPAQLFGVAVERLIPWVALAPIPVWFIGAAFFSEPAAWRERYRATDDEAVAVEVYERKLSHVWSGKFFADVPGGLDAASFVAEFDTCVTLDEAKTIPIMLVADGAARFSLDGEEQLVAETKTGDRAVRGKKLALAAGTHHVLVEFAARKRPSVGLLASWDGDAPTALESGRVAPGVHVFRPVAGEFPCGPTK
jgi:hypothetical protein